MLQEPITHQSSTEWVTLPEIVAAFSYALDLTEGQPAGHSARCCWIGSKLGEAIGLDARERDELFYALLLKDLGCSSNAARICELYEADDLAFKRGFKTVGTGLAASIRFVMSRSAAQSRWHERPAKVGRILREAPAYARELILSRCTRGADIARSLRFSERVCAGIYSLDEHWDGSGKPDGLAGASIPLFARIALLAQVADVFHSHAGAAAALDEVRRRAGSWLDPELATAFERLASFPGFWETVTSPLLGLAVQRFAPSQDVRQLDEDYLDSIVEAFGQVVDAKSPFTAGHSLRVGNFTNDIAETMGIGPDRRRPLRRAALLHDVGKLGVPNTILDKPASLDDDEWRTMRSHADHTREILSRIGAMASLADVAAAHHERLDGRGYPRALEGAQIARETRIITLSDFFDALTADRPYRSAMPVEQAMAIMQSEVGKAIDGECFDALRQLLATENGG